MNHLSYSVDVPRTSYEKAEFCAYRSSAAKSLSEKNLKDIVIDQKTFDKLKKRGIRTPPKIRSSSLVRRLSSKVDLARLDFLQKEVPTTTNLSRFHSLEQFDSSTLNSLEPVSPLRNSIPDIKLDENSIGDELAHAIRLEGKVSPTWSESNTETFGHSSGSDEDDVNVESCDNESYFTARDNVESRNWLFDDELDKTPAIEGLEKISSDEGVTDDDEGTETSKGDPHGSSSTLSNIDQVSEHCLKKNENFLEMNSFSNTPDLGNTTYLSMISDAEMELECGDVEREDAHFTNKTDFLERSNELPVDLSASPTKSDKFEPVSDSENEEVNPHEVEESASVANPNEDVQDQEEMAGANHKNNESDNDEISVASLNSMLTTLIRFRYGQGLNLSYLVQDFFSRFSLDLYDYLEKLGYKKSIDFIKAHSMIYRLEKKNGQFVVHLVEDDPENSKERALRSEGFSKIGDTNLDALTSELESLHFSHTERLGDENKENKTSLDEQADSQRFAMPQTSTPIRRPTEREVGKIYQELNEKTKEEAGEFDNQKRIGVICSKTIDRFFVYCPDLKVEPFIHFSLSLEKTSKLKMGDWIEFSCHRFSNGHMRVTSFRQIEAMHPTEQFLNTIKLTVTLSVPQDYTPEKYASKVSCEFVKEAFDYKGSIAENPSLFGKQVKAIVQRRKWQGTDTPWGVIQIFPSSATVQLYLPVEKATVVRENPQDIFKTRRAFEQHGLRSHRDESPLSDSKSRVALNEIFDKEGAKDATTSRKPRFFSEGGKHRTNETFAQKSTGNQQKISNDISHETANEEEIMGTGPLLTTSFMELLNGSSDFQTGGKRATPFSQSSSKTVDAYDKWDPEKFMKEPDATTSHVAENYEAKLRILSLLESLDALNKPVLYDSFANEYFSKFGVRFQKPEIKNLFGISKPNELFRTTLADEVEVHIDPKMPAQFFLKLKMPVSEITQIYEKLPPEPVKCPPKSSGQFPIGAPREFKPKSCKNYHQEAEGTLEYALSTKNMDQTMTWLKDNFEYHSQHMREFSNALDFWYKSELTQLVKNAGGELPYEEIRFYFLQKYDKDMTIEEINRLLAIRHVGDSMMAKVFIRLVDLPEPSMDPELTADQDMV